VIEYAVGFSTLHSITIGTLLPRANAAACPQLAKADLASSSQYVREGQRIAASDDMLVETLWPVALALLLGRRGRRTYGF
jgi:hypothetical protein